MRRIVFICAAALVAAGGFMVTIEAQDAKKVSEGVYTAEQAKRGEAVYKEQCAACHGDMLEGSGPMPALAGPDFAKIWSGKTAAELFEKTQSTMPATAPGSLTPEQTADVLAYMFSVAKHPVGTTALPSTPEGLKGIAIDK